MRPGSPTTSGGKRRMAEDGKEDSVATDDESDHTAADGTGSLNNTMVEEGSTLLRRMEICVAEAEKRSGKNAVNMQETFTVYLIETRPMDAVVEGRNPAPDSLWRRYSEFELLRNYLIVTYPYIVVPPLPEKRAEFVWHKLSADNMDPDFVERRRVGLENFLLRVASHPVLSNDQILYHFLTEEHGWKEVVYETGFQAKADSRLRALSATFRVRNPDKMSCQSGYKDALRFLEENKLLMLERPTSGLALTESPPNCCCKHTESTKEWVLRRLRLLRKRHWWLDEQIVLPMPIKKVFCEACQDKPGLYAKVSSMLPMRVASYMLMPYTLPVQSAYSVAQRFVEWIPEVPADVSWLFGVAGDVYRQAWKGEPASSMSEPCLRKCLSAPPLPTECDEPMYRDNLPALSSLDLHGSYWETNRSTSSCSDHHPHVAPSSPQQVCFLVGSEDESHSHAQQ